MKRRFEADHRKECAYRDDNIFGGEHLNRWRVPASKASHINAMSVKFKGIKISDSP